MKKIILILIIILFPVPVQALDLETCKVVSELSIRVMVKRQEGFPMADLMEAGSGNEVLQMLIVGAYKKPRYSTEKMKQISVEDFSNGMYLACVEEL